MEDAEEDILKGAREHMGFFEFTCWLPMGAPLTWKHADVALTQQRIEVTDNGQTVVLRRVTDATLFKALATLVLPGSQDGPDVNSMTALMTACDLVHPQ